MNRSPTELGVTLIEMMAVLVISVSLIAAGSKLYSGFGSRGAANLEAGNLVDNLWDLRAKATAGMKNPCLDFPDSVSFRVYSDTSEIPDGFDAGDLLIQTHSFSAGTKVLSISGGNGPGHFVCFESKGVLGSANAALLVTVGRDSTNGKRVRLLPATGMARAL